MAYKLTLDDINEAEKEGNPSRNQSIAPNASQPQSQQSPGYFQQFANDAKQEGRNALQSTLGAGDAIRDFLGNTAKALPNPFIDSQIANQFGNQNPSINSNFSGANFAPSSSGQQYQIGRALGDTGTFMAGGAGLDALRGAAESVPYLGAIARGLGSDVVKGKGFVNNLPGWLSGAARRAIGTGAYSAINDPNNRTDGAMTGAVASVAGDLVPSALRGAGLIRDAFRPQAYSEEIMKGLSGGQSLEQNAQGLAQNINSSYGQQVANTENRYKPIFDQLGNNPIYNRVNPIYGVSQKGAYEKLGDNVTNKFGGDLEDMHNNFIANPSLNNAHQLQSQLGREIGSMQSANSKGALDQIGKSTLSSYQKARTALQGDIKTYLSGQGLDNVSNYLGASQDYKQNVTPYLDGANLSQISKGDITNPANLANLFKSPEPGMQKVISDMGPDANRQILYSMLGRRNVTPESLLGAFSDLDKQGLGSYITPELQRQMQNLSAKVSARNVAMAGLGSKISPALLALRNAIPISKILGGAINTGAPAYPLLRQALLANSLNGGNQQ